jgi:hypothetical protein
MGLGSAGPWCIPAALAFGIGKAKNMLIMITSSITTVNLCIIFFLSLVIMES